MKKTIYFMFFTVNRQATIKDINWRPFIGFGSVTGPIGRPSAAS